MVSVNIGATQASARIAARWRQVTVEYGLLLFTTYVTDTAPQWLVNVTTPGREYAIAVTTIIIKQCI